MVLVGYNHPNRELYEYLTPGGINETNTRIHLVGDVVGTNGIMPAIHQAAGVAREI